MKKRIKIFLIELGITTKREAIDRLLALFFICFNVYMLMDFKLFIHPFNFIGINLSIWIIGIFINKKS